MKKLILLFLIIGIFVTSCDTIIKENIQNKLKAILGNNIELTYQHKLK